MGIAAVRLLGRSEMRSTEDEAKGNDGDNLAYLVDRICGAINRIGLTQQEDKLPEGG